jgi:hypothetical protein
MCLHVQGACAYHGVHACDHADCCCCYILQLCQHKHVYVLTMVCICAS